MFQSKNYVFNKAKTHPLKFLFALLALSSVSPLLADSTDPAASDFPHVVKFETGDADFAPGDNITIQEVRGTSTDIAPGGTYCVTGTYTLSSEADAKLALFATSRSTNATPVDPKQSMHIEKGTGTFRLIKHVADDGYLHVSFYPSARGQGFGGVYFGQGKWVLRGKHYGAHKSAGQSGQSLTREGISFAGPNMVLFEYLGNPIPPPADLDPAYTREGLTRAVQAAADTAGVSLAKLEIDDSEFPFLIGLVFAHPGDKAKFIKEIDKVTAYSDSGGVGDGINGISYALDLTPYRAYPAQSGDRISHRITLRESVLFDKITGKL